MGTESKFGFILDDAVLGVCDNLADDEVVVLTSKGGCIAKCAAPVALSRAHMQATYGCLLSECRLRADTKFRYEE